MTDSYTSTSVCALSLPPKQASEPVRYLYSTLLIIDLIMNLLMIPCTVIILWAKNALKNGVGARRVHAIKNLIGLDTADASYHKPWFLTRRSNMTFKRLFWFWARIIFNFRKMGNFPPNTRLSAWYILTRYLQRCLQAFGHGITNPLWITKDPS